MTGGNRESGGLFGRLHLVVGRTLATMISKYVASEDRS